MSRRMMSGPGVALIRSVTMSVQWPKMPSRRSFSVPSLSLPPAASLWKPYLWERCLLVLRNLLNLPQDPESASTGCGMCLRIA